MIPPPICKLMLIMFYNIFFIPLQSLFVVFLYFLFLDLCCFENKKNDCVKKNMV